MGYLTDTLAAMGSPRRVLVGLGLVAALGCGLSGCSGDEDAKSDPTTTAADAVSGQDGGGTSGDAPYDSSCVDASFVVSPSNAMSSMDEGVAAKMLENSQAFLETLTDEQREAFKFVGQKANEVFVNGELDEQALAAQGSDPELQAAQAIVSGWFTEHCTVQAEG